MLRSYSLPQDIQDFIKENGPLTSYNSWYSLNGKLYNDED